MNVHDKNPLKPWMRCFFSWKTAAAAAAAAKPNETHVVLQLSTLRHCGALLRRLRSVSRLPLEWEPAHSAGQPGRQAGSQAGSAAVRWAEEGRAQRHCGQEAAPITPGALGGE